MRKSAEHRRAKPGIIYARVCIYAMSSGARGARGEDDTAADAATIDVLSNRFFMFERAARECVWIDMIVDWIAGVCRYTCACCVRCSDDGGLCTSACTAPGQINSHNEPVCAHTHALYMQRVSACNESSPSESVAQPVLRLRRILTRNWSIF